ncbi:hypothetical protein M3Y99_01616400 [Aphelenchoides fujianensis]|nr:hypothetical protein M3Y99_01616400 [Aphelenchoides fujianensis]
MVVHSGSSAQRRAFSATALVLLSVVAMSAEATSPLLPGNSADLDVESKVNLEDFHSADEQPNPHVKSLALAVSFENGTTAENERFYAQAIANLRKATPNLESVSFDGGYIFNPKEDNAETFKAEVKALDEHFKLLARLFKSAGLNVKKVHFVGMWTFEQKTVEAADYANLLTKTFDLKADEKPAAFQANFTKQIDGIPFEVKLSLSISILKNSDANRSRFYDAVVTIQG